jgi:N-acetyl-alpha-D-glucosaminyl L-malate synthase BshA
VRDSLIVVSLPTFGGSGIVATELGVAAARRGWEVHFVSAAPPVRLALHSSDPEIRGRVSFHQVATQVYAMFHHQPYTLALASKIAQVAKRHEVPVVHAHYAIPHTIAAHLAREMLDGQTSVVTTLHGTDITIVGLDPSYRDIVTYALNASNAVTAVSQFLRDSTRREFPFKGAIDVIPNFVAPEVFHPDQPEAKAIRECYAPEGKALLIHVSNYRTVKRAPVACEIFASVRAEAPAHMLMIGEGPDRAKTEECAERLEISEDVTFIDSTLELPPYLAASDVMLMPSQSESFGLAALEAMACGTPVVASAIGGLPEVIDDGVDGQLLPPEDAAGMAEAVLALLNDRSRLERMSQAAAAKPQVRFPRDEQVDKYLDVYCRARQHRSR